MKFHGDNPMNKLKKSVGQDIKVKLKDETVYKGNLVDIDGYMNIVLGSATEYLFDTQVAVYEEIYIRGGSVLYIRLPKKEIKLI